MAQKMSRPLNVSNRIGLMLWTRQITVTQIVFVTFRPKTTNLYTTALKMH